MEKFYFCYVDGKSMPTKKHLSLLDAQTEAERLAHLPDNLGRKVYILATDAYCQVVYPPINWVIL